MGSQSQPLEDTLILHNINCPSDSIICPSQPVLATEIEKLEKLSQPTLHIWGTKFLEEISVNLQSESCEDDLEKFVCNRCNYETEDIGNFKEHMREKHRIFECDECEHTSSSSYGLKAHKELKHFKPVQQKPVTSQIKKRKAIGQTRSLIQPSSLPTDVLDPSAPGPSPKPKSQPKRASKPTPEPFDSAPRGGRRPMHQCEICLQSIHN